MMTYWDDSKRPNGFVYNAQLIPYEEDYVKERFGKVDGEREDTSRG